MNFFKRDGFDTIISNGVIVTGSLVLPAGSTTIIDGELIATSIRIESKETEKELKAMVKTKLVVGGKIHQNYSQVEPCNLEIIVPNVTITGELTCDLLIVEGTLAIKSGAKLKAREIRYREIHMEHGAVVIGQIGHLDHISAGEQT